MIYLLADEVQQLLRIEGCTLKKTEEQINVSEVLRSCVALCLFVITDVDLKCEWDSVAANI